MYFLKKYFFVLIGLLLHAGNLFAIVAPEDSLESSKFEYEASLPDSSFIRDSIQRLTAEQMLKSNPPPQKEFQYSKSPTDAILYSLIFPGAGQLYVESYWKVPIFAGAAGALIYFIVSNHSQFVTFGDEADNYKDELGLLKTELANLPPEEDPTPLETAISQTEQKLDLSRRKREFYRDNRDMSAFYLLGVYLISAIDAYVGAHLFDFSVDDDITLRFVPEWNKGMAVKLYLRF